MPESGGFSISHYSKGQPDAELQRPRIAHRSADSGVPLDARHATEIEVAGAVAPPVDRYGRFISDALIEALLP